MVEGYDVDPRTFKPLEEVLVVGGHRPDPDAWVAFFELLGLAPSDSHGEAVDADVDCFDVVSEVLYEIGAFGVGLEVHSYVF